MNAPEVFALKAQLAEQQLRAEAAEAKLAEIKKHADGYDQLTDRMWKIRRVLGEP